MNSGVSVLRSWYWWGLIAIVLLLIFSGIVVGTRTDASTASPVFFTVLHTNDEHSSLIPRGPAVNHIAKPLGETSGGFARLAAAIGSQREMREKETVVTVSAGDFYSGSPYAWLALRGDAPELQLLQDMHYDLVVLGNHEFDLGPNGLVDYLTAAGYPDAVANTAILASNVEIPDDHPLDAMGIEGTHLIPLADGEMTLGFFSLLGDDAQAVMQDVKPLGFSDPITTAKVKVNALQDAGADVIIAVNHSGVREDRMLARQVDGIDVIISGHCHTPLKTPVIEAGVIIVQAGDRLDYLGCLELAWCPERETLSVRNEETGQPLLIPLDALVEPDPTFSDKIDRYTERLNRQIETMTGSRYRDVFEIVGVSSEPISRAALPFSESPLGNLVTDAFIWSVERQLGERPDVAFQANGQLRGDILPGSAGDVDGQIAFYDVVEQVGLGLGPDGEPGYPVISMFLTGQEIRNILEISSLLSQLMGEAAFLQVSGLSVEYDVNRAVLFQVPFLNMPIPTLRAVLGATLTSPIGDDQILEGGDDTLYHVVSDYYVAGFIPMVGDVVPQLTVIPKHADGTAMENLTEGIVMRNGRELKAWEAVVDYVAHERHEGAKADLAHKYGEVSGRLVSVSTLPLWLWPVAIMIVFGFGLWGLWRRRRQ